MSLIVQIGADATEYLKAMGMAGETAEKTAKRITDELVKAGKAVDKFGAAAKNGANQAGNALQNLSRVAQDAPYGFIGIQNNLNPLLESFQRLKQETGSTGAAFKALTNSLMGAAGIGLALAVVSSAISFYTMWQQKANKEAKIGAETNDEYVNSLNAVTRAQIKAEQGGQSELTRLQILYKATQNHTLSLETRNSAYDELSRKYQKFFPDAEREQTLLGQNAKAYETLAGAIMQAAYAKAYEEEITSLEKTKIINSNKILEITKQEVKVQGELNKSKKTANELSKAASSGAGQGAGGFLIQQTMLNRDLNKLVAERTVLEQQNAKIQTQQSDLSTRATAAEIAANFKTGSQLDDKNKKLKEQKGAYDELKTSIGELQGKLEDAITADAGPTIVSKLSNDLLIAQERLAEVDKKIKNSLLAGGGREDIADAVNPNGKINTAQKTTETESGFEKAKKSLAGLIKFKTTAIIQNKEYAKSVKEEDSNLKLLSMTVGQGLQGAFQAAISGTQSFASAFGEFIAQLIAKIVSAIAAAAILASILSFTGLGAVMGATGGFSGGASQLGSFSNLLGQFTGVKLASGGVTTGPTHALIGEGREQEAVLPLSHLDKMLSDNGKGGGGFTDGQIVGIFRGADLLFQFKAANKQAKRVGGAV